MGSEMCIRDSLYEIELRDTNLDIDTPVEVVKSTYCLVEDDATYMVVRDQHGEFSAGPVVVKDGPWGEKHITQWTGSKTSGFKAGTIYYPIDGRITLADVAIATRAVPNEFNTGWMLLPASDEDAMLDEEHTLRSAVVGQFAEAIDAAQVKVNEATNATVRTRVVSVHALLVAFRNNVADAAVATAQSRYIGWLEQYPEEAHIHLLVKDAVNATVSAWQTAVSYTHLTLPTKA